MGTFKIPIPVLIALLMLLASLGGCAYGTIKPEDVKEYRNFPEYGGYFPIVGENVQADWVLPEGQTADGKPDYTAPLTREEAEKRVKETADRGRVVHPTVKASAGILLWYPAMVLTAAVVIPGLIISPLLPTEKWSPEARAKEEAERKQRELVQFLGVTVNIKSVDAEGNPVPEPRVIEAGSPMDIPTYVDKDGRRTFAPVSYNFYTLSPATLELLTRDLQTYPKDKELLVDHKGDQSGVAAYTSLEFARFAEYGEKRGWHWAREPIPLTFSFIVWAPGFMPSLYTATGVRHGDALDFTVTLKKEGQTTPPADTSLNIWSLKERYDSFVMHVLPLESVVLDPKTVEEARDILKKGEVVDPDFPGLDTLRAVVALADGDRKRAATLSHYVSHYTFFKLFYGLTVSLPLYK